MSTQKKMYNWNKASNIEIQENYKSIKILKSEWALKIKRNFMSKIDQKEKKYPWKKKIT